MPSLLTRPMRAVCDQTRVRLRCDEPFDNNMKYTVRGSWIYLPDITSATGGCLRADMNLIKQSLVESLMARQITIFEHNQFISLLQLIEARAHFPDDFWVWDYDFEIQYTLETWIMINASPVEEVDMWPDPDSVVDFPEIESVSSLHYSSDGSYWIDDAYILSIFDEDEETDDETTVEISV